MQIIVFLKLADVGMSIKALCRSGGFSQPTFYNWRFLFGGLALQPLTSLDSVKPA